MTTVLIMFTILVSFSISQLVVLSPVTLTLMMTAPANASWFHCWMVQSVHPIRYCSVISELFWCNHFPRVLLFTKIRPKHVFHEVQSSLPVVSEGALCVLR